jgi:hypothetical protein
MSVGNTKEKDKNNFYNSLITAKIDKQHFLTRKKIDIYL